MKDMQCHFRIDEDEYKILFVKAKKEGIPMSQLLRKAISMLLPGFGCVHKVVNIENNN